MRDTEVCTIAGVVDAGADCGTMVSGRKYRKTFDEVLDSLEPNETRPGAAIIPFDDLIHLKTQLEKACQKLRCSSRTKSVLNNINSFIGSITNK